MCFLWVVWLYSTNFAQIYCPSAALQYRWRYKWSRLLFEKLSLFSFRHYKQQAVDSRLSFNGVFILQGNSACYLSSKFWEFWILFSMVYELCSAARWGATETCLRMPVYMKFALRQGCRRFFNNFRSFRVIIVGNKWQRHLERIPAIWPRQWHNEFIMTDSKCNLSCDKSFMSGRLRVVKYTVLSDIFQGVKYSNVKKPV